MSLKQRVVQRYAAAQRAELDVSEAVSAARSSDSRWDDNKKNFQEYKNLRRKGDERSKKQMSKHRDALEASGDEAVKAAKRLLSTYAKMAEGYRGKAKQERQSTLDLLDQYVSSLGTSAGDGIEDTYGKIQKLEAVIQILPRVLRGEYDAQLDESWRNH